MKPVGICLCLMTLIGCDATGPSNEKTVTVSQDHKEASQDSLIPADAESLSQQNGQDETPMIRTAIIGGSEIPYPIYPNGSRYRVGGENGLRIVLYQTEDPFEEVDRFYQSKAQEVGMPRLSGMDDYVRYATGEEDLDPWGTTRPGIVIHQFNNDKERAAVGADREALTNIIMSF
jgi:hypothetical protein